ncbi:1,3-beta-glucanosyltransferase [Dispira simplex]|nr:1,3-beta-glucanosyltransferase [Dispira simplex]
MVNWKLFLGALALLSVNSMVSAAKIKNQLTISGNKFFNTKTKVQEFIKGVVYRPNITMNDTWDVLADPEGCSIHIPYLQELGANAIRVPENYTDSSADHKDCMNQLADANINVFLDIAAVNATKPSYDSFMLDGILEKIDAFRNYTNFVGVFTGNEVVTDNKTTVAAAYIKAITRDIKAYSEAKNLQLYVGYAAGDDPVTRYAMLQYLNCGNVKEQVDFYAVNLHTWCGDDADYENTGFKDAVQNFTNINKPVLLGEFGCLGERPQKFGEVNSLFGKDMVEEFSGGFASEYSQVTEDYGLVKVGSRGVSTLDEFDYLKDVYTNNNPKTTKMDNQESKKSSLSCPRVSPDWQSHTKLPPLPSSKACQCMVDSFTCSLAFGSDDTDPDALDRLFKKMCPVPKCPDIFSDTANGVYGTWSMCPEDVRIAIAINQNYTKTKGEEEKTCEYKNVATDIIKNPKVESAKTCSRLRTKFEQEAEAEDDSGVGPSVVLDGTGTWKSWGAMVVALGFAALVI